MAKLNFLKLARLASTIASEKKGNDIVILNVKKLTTVADYFVLISADSTPQISAIINTIERTFRDDGLHVLRRDGIDSPNWTVLDYGGIVIHVMTPAVRTFYALEKVWVDAKKV